MAPVGEQAWIQFAFATAAGDSRRRRWRSPGSKWPFGPPPPGPDLEASDDGRTFRKIVEHSAQHGRAEHGLVPAGRRAVLQGGVPDAAAGACDSAIRHSASAAADRAPDRGARAAHRRARQSIRGEGGVRAARRTSRTCRRRRSRRPTRCARATSSISRRRCGPTARSTGRRRPASGSCSAWAIHCWASRTTPRRRRAPGSRWTS